MGPKDKVLSPNHKTSPPSTPIYPASSNRRQPQFIMSEEGKIRRQQKQKRMVIVPIPLVGHLLTAVELAKLLVDFPTTVGHLSITIISIPQLLTSDAEVSSFLSSVASSLPAAISFLNLPTVPPPPFPANVPFEARICALLELYKPLVKSSIDTLLSNSSVTALVLDLFCSSMVDLGQELHIPAYVFFTSGTSFLGLLLHFPTAVDPLLPNSGKAIEMGVDGTTTTIPFPGFSSRLPVSAFPDALAFGKNEAYQAFLDCGRRLRGADGFLVNTFDELQPNATKALEEGLYLDEDCRHRGTPLVYNVGPLLSFKPEPEHECVKWLDGQPRRSVVFLCFGSMGRFPEAQVRDTAVGLERSGHRFLWVMGNVGQPEGFEERTKERGLVWMSFAPQKEILQHEAVGGFVTHCGWNSFLEAVWFGVPMAAWPLYAEQHFNAHEMVEEMGITVAVRAERSKGNRATAEEVERAVRLLMGEGSAGVREKVRVMKEAARRAVEDGGSSYQALEKVAMEWSKS